MAYKRITRDEYEIQGYYTNCWEVVCTEATLKEARQTLRAYDQNETKYAHRIKKKRVRIDGDRE